MNEALPPHAALAEARSLLAARRFAEAERIFGDLVRRDPKHSLAWFLYGVAQAERGDVPAARASFARSFALEPSQPPGHHLAHANLLLEARDPSAAEHEARLALRSVPRFAPALATLAIALLQQDRLEEALAAAGDATAADPSYARGRATHASILRRAGRRREAAADLLGAIDLYRRALSIHDASAGLWNDLGNAYANAAMHAQAQAAYREALARDPADARIESNLLTHLHYDPTLGNDAIFDAHRAWAARHAAALAASTPPPLPAPAGHGRLRVGFLSPALREGPTASFLEPLLAHLDRERFEVHAYAVDGSSDATTARLRAFCDGWHDLRGAGDDAVAARIRGDRIHLLVDLAGHTPGGRPLVLARKPAPVIATWLDYFDTTGLDTVDFLLGDPVSTPEGGGQRFTERVVRIAPSRLCYAPPPNVPEVAPAPALHARAVTFGSFNRLSKLAPPVVSLWSRVLAALPSSRLLLKAGALRDERIREETAARFAREGVDRDRIELRGDSPHAAMLAEYGDLDIALDPFPYNGGLTTCEALWMGVPVLTLLGDSMIGRQGASLVAAAGLQDWVCRSEDELVERALAKALEIEALARLRAGMRTRLRASPLLDGGAFAARFGEALLAMWEARRG